MPETDDEAMLQAAEALIRLRDDYGFRLLMAQLHKEVAADAAALVDVDPDNKKEITRLQQNIKGLNWLADRMQVLIQQGMQPETLSEANVEYVDG